MITEAMLKVSLQKKGVLNVTQQLSPGLYGEMPSERLIGEG
jgi:hypothetical protein